MVCLITGTAYCRKYPTRSWQVPSFQRIHKLPTHSQQIIDLIKHTADNFQHSWQLPTHNWQLPKHSWQLPIHCLQLPTCNWQLPTHCWQFPTYCWVLTMFNALLATSNTLLLTSNTLPITHLLQFSLHCWQLPTHYWQCRHTIDNCQVIPDIFITCNKTLSLCWQLPKHSTRYSWNCWPISIRWHSIFCRQFSTNSDRKILHFLVWLDPVITTKNTTKNIVGIPSKTWQQRWQFSLLGHRT